MRKWKRENQNEMHYNAYTAFCQNSVLGLQWNMKIKSKVENYKKKNNNNNNRTNKQTNKKEEMIDKLKTWIKKQTHAERVGKKNTRSKIKDGKTEKNE